MTVVDLIYVFCIVAGAWRNGRATIKTAPFYIDTNMYVCVFYLPTRHE